MGFSYTRRMRGFSLVELSIVLVILGLLVGGILAGQSLIRASELRAVGAEFSRYQTAAHAFRDKYFALPGDFPGATKVWGRLTSANAYCVTNSSAAVAAPGACDGDGDGLVSTYPGAQNLSGEVYQFWRQLALAGMIEGDYTGLSGSLNGGHHEFGKNDPASKLNGSGWAAFYYANGGSTAYNGIEYGNTLFMGTSVAGSTPYGANMTPQEMWNLDTKLDDGKPASGNVIGRYYSNACAKADDGTSEQDDLAASYRLSANGIYCAPIFRKVF